MSVYKRSRPLKLVLKKMLPELLRELRHEGALRQDLAPLLRPEEVAERWSLNVKSVYAAIRQGQLPAVRLARRVLRVPRRSILRIEKGVPTETANAVHSH